MKLFIILFIVIALLAIMDYYSQHHLGLWIAAIIMAVVAGIRYNTGYDYGSYYWYYVAKQGSFEKGFEWLNSFGHLLHLNVFEFQIFYAFLTLGLLSYFLYSNVSPGIGGFGLLYYFSRFYWVRDLGQIRSSLASVICLYSIKYIKEKRPIPFLIIILIAQLVHRGAIVFIFAYLIANYFNKNVDFAKTIFYLIGAYIVGIILKHYPAIVQKLTHSSAYVTQSAYVNNSSGSIVTLLVQFAIIMFYIYTKHYENRSDLFMNVTANVYLTGILVALALIGYRTLGYRLDTILNTTEIIMVPYLINKTFNNKALVVVINVIVSALMLYMIMFYDHSYLNFVPFNTMFIPIK